MQVLNEEQMCLVNGGTIAGDIAMVAATGWASTVVGFAAGTMVAGPYGAAIGAAAGLLIGVGTGIGYVYSGGSFGGGGGSDLVSHMLY